MQPGSATLFRRFPERARHRRRCCHKVNAACSTRSSRLGRIWPTGDRQRQTRLQPAMSEPQTDPTSDSCGISGRIASLMGDLLETAERACKGVDSVNDRKPSKPRGAPGTWVLLACLSVLTNLTPANAQEPTDLPSGRAADSENPSSGLSVVPGGQDLRGYCLAPGALTSRVIRGQPRVFFLDWNSTASTTGWRSPLAAFEMLS